jgi:VCBS repeat-containing protein
MTFLVTNPDNRTDGGTLELDGADSIASADVGGFTYVFVAGGVDDGVSVFRLLANGTLTPVFDVTDTATLKLDGATGLSTAMVDGNTYLFVAGVQDSGVSVFRVGTDGSLTNTGNVSDDATMFLSGVTDTATAKVGTSTYLFTAGTADDGISVFRVAGNGALTNIGNTADNGTLKLDGVDALTTVTVGGTTFLIAAGGVDDGISVFSIAANGTLTNTNNFSDNATLNLNGASDVTSAVIGGVTYVFVAGAADNGISVFSLNSSGILTNVFNFTDTVDTLVAGATSLSISTIGTSTYLLVGGTESGLSMFRVETGSNSNYAAGSLTFVDNIADQGSRELSGTVSTASASIGGTNYFLGAGATDDGVSSFRSTASGQLYFFAQGGGADGRLAYVNNDGGNQTSFVDDSPSTDLVTTFPEELGVDTAAGFYFALVNGGNDGSGARLVRGSLSGGAVTTLVTYDGVNNVIGDLDDEIVNAIQVDVINHKVYLGVQDPEGDGPGQTGIFVYDYNATTGAISNGHFLTTVTSSGKPQESGFDILDVRDFDVDPNTHLLFFTELLTGGVSANGLFRLDINNPNVILQLVPQAQFPDNGSNGYITDVEVDNTTGIVYFDVESQHAFPNAGYVAGQNNIYWISETANGSTNATLLTLNGLPGGNHFYPGDMVFDQGTRQLYVESEETDDGSGADTDDVVYVFQLSLDGHSATLINTISLVPPVTNIAANIGGMIFNDIPLLASVNGTATHVGEQGGVVQLLTGAPTITDADGDHLSSATVQVTQGLFSSNDSNATDDRLFFGTTLAASGSVAGTSITWAYNSATNTLTFTGYDTLANYQTALAGVRFQSLGDNPTNYGLDTTRTITWTVSDGAVGVPGGSQNSATTTITIDAVNDGPTNTVPGTQTVTEDVAKVISGLSMSDPDANPAITNVTVTLSVLHGTLTLLTNVAGGLTAGQIANNGTATVTITAPLNDINATLANAAGLTYASIADYNGSDTLHIVTDDGGNTGSGGAHSDTDDVAITINPVVDIANDTLSFNEDSGTHTLSMPNNDTFENSNRAITAVGSASHGTVTINNNGTAGDNTDDFIVYTQNADYNGSDSFTYTVTSGGVTETATVTVNIAAVADIVNDSATTNEDTAVSVLVLANDTFEGTPAITGTGAAAHGVVTINNNGTAGDTTDDYLVYTPNADYNGSDSFTYTVTSGGVTETATVNVTINAVADIADDNVTVAEDSGTNNLNGIGNVVSLLANDSFESAARFISAVTQGLHGTVAINNNGTPGNTADDFVTYTPASNYNGPDSFTYTVTSGGVTETATVNVTVTAVNDAPVNTVPGTQTINEDASRTFSTVGGNAISVADIDVGAGTLTVTLTVAHGTLTLSGTTGLSFGPGDGTADATMTFTGTATDINNALNGLVYTPNGDFNGSDTLSITTNDNGNTGTPGALQDVDTVTINITAINDAPTVVNGATVSVPATNEDTPGTGATFDSLLATHYSDAADNQIPNGGASSPGAFSGVAVTANGSSGATGQWQYFNGSIWIDIGSASDAAAKLFTNTTQLRFNPTPDYNGPAPTLTVHLIDNSLGFGITNAQVVNISAPGATGGTTAYSAGTVAIDTSVASINDAPTQSGLQGDAATWTENGGAIPLDVGQNAIISDIDSPNFDTGSLTVLLSGGAVAEDGLFILATGGITFDATTVSFNGTQFATYLGGGFGGGNIVFTFDADATLAAVNALFHALGYNNSGNSTGEYPTAGSRSVTWTLVDGDGTASGGHDTLLIGSSVNVVPLNDTPAVSLAASAASTEQVAGALDAAATVHDADLDARNSGNGDYSGSTLTIANNGGNNANDLFAFGASGAFTVSGSNLQSGGLTFATFTGGNGTPLVVTFTSSGTPATTALVNAVLDAVQYTYTGDNPPASIDAIVSMNDGAPANAGQGSVAGNSATGSDIIHINITNTPEDLAPVVDLNTGTAGFDDTNLYVEGGSASGIGTAISVTDADAGDNIESATITITNAQAGDLLSVTLPLPPGISVDTVNSTATTLILIGSATPSAYAGALGQVGYSSTSNDPTVSGTHTSRDITVVTNDGSLDSNIATMHMNVAGTNDEPTLVATAANPTFTEGGAAADLFSAVTASTVEGGQTLTSLTLTVSNVTDGASELLTIDGSSVALTNGNSVVTSGHGLTVNVTLAGSTATVTFAGASLSEAQLGTLVDSLAYANASDNPTTADRVVTITELVDSGSNAAPNDNTAALSLSSTVHITPTNDAAVITGTATGDVTEAGGVNNATPGVPTATGDLNSTDIDNPADSWQAVAPGAASVNGYGTFQLSATGVWTYTLDDSNPAVNALNPVSTLTDTFVVHTIDGTAQTVTVTIHGQDDGAVAKPDYFTVNPGAQVSGNLFADNGSGPDTDPDGPALTVAEVNGESQLVGSQFTLSSGGKLTVHSDGTFTYIAPNSTLGTDTFIYRLAGTDDPVTVTLGINQVIMGTPNPDTLTGGAGNDFIDGLASADSMTGGIGNDSYVVDNAGDVIHETAGQGIDTVYTSLANFTLAAGVSAEGLSSTNQNGTAAQNLTGNEVGNAIYGTQGANQLDGAGGHDILLGFGGNDIYFVDAEDEIVEAVGGGTDTAYARGDYVLRAGVELEVLSTANQGSLAAQSLTGNEFANVLYGNAGANHLDGGGGADILVGLGGDDVYNVNSTDDQVIEFNGGGNDSVYATGNYTLAGGSEIEQLLSSDPLGTTAQSLTGNEYNNTITGNAGANVISGGGGTDTLIGLAGDDTYFVDSNDSVVEAVGGGTDVVYASTSYQLAANSEIEVLSSNNQNGTTAQDLTGNEFANVIYGNAGANVLDGRSGSDILIGLGGADTFAFTTALAPGNIDTVYDFASGTDKISLSAAVFAGLSAGPLAPGAFVIGTSAQDADDRIIYDSATGNLYFDADGNGGGAQVLFAHINGHPTVLSTDFVIVP